MLIKQNDYCTGELVTIKGHFYFEKQHFLGAEVFVFFVELLYRMFNCENSCLELQMVIWPSYLNLP